MVASSSDDKCSRPSPHGWTLDTLEKYLSDRIDALKDQVRAQDEQNKERFAAAKEQVTLALTAAEKAITKAEMASDKRFEGVNEFRGLLADQQRSLVPRAEYEVQHKALIDQITAQRDQLTMLAGRSQGIGAIGTTLVSGAVGLAAALGVWAALGHAVAR